MPELPDVEVFRRYLESTSLDRPIEHVHVLDADLLGVPRQRLASLLTGHRIIGTKRRGKHLGALVNSGGVLILHFGMTGFLESCEDDAEPPDHTALLLDFEDGTHLAYVNVRKLGKISAADDFDAYVAREKIGPDALEFSAGELGSLFSGRRGTVKGLLMNQELIAGLGNVYADEILYDAKVAPTRKAADVDESEIKSIHSSMRRVIDKAIECEARPDRMPRTWLLPHRDEGGDCPRCGTSLRADKVSGRTTWWCPCCQE